MNRSRRALLTGFAAIGIAGVAETRIAQDDGDGEDEDEEAERTFELIGYSQGWEGVSPAEIEGETNPTLTMEAGEDYTVVWENGDGVGHNFAIDGTDIETDIITEGTQTVEFTASEEMEAYVCQPHRESMEGDIALEGEETPEVDSAPPAEEEPDGDPVEVFEFTLGEEEWSGESPSEIDGETNPTLSLEAGEIYEISFSVESDRPEYQPGHYLAIYREDGSQAARSAFAKDGESESLKFTAEEDIVAYRDQTQLEAGGDIELN